MSDIGIQELEYLWRQYLKLPHGEERVEAIRYAIKRADELGIQEWRLENRYYLRDEIYRWGDEGELLPQLSEFISIFEEQPIMEYVPNYLYSFYSSLNQWNCFPQLPLEERKKVADHFLQACKRYHANLGVYYDREYVQCRKEGKIGEAKMYQKKALEALQKRTPIQVSDCEACEQYRRVRYAVDNKDWELAVKEAQPLLDGMLKCRQHPKKAICELLTFALDSGDWEKSESYAELLEGLPEPEWEDHSWTLMRYYAFTDLEKGLEIFQNILPYIVGIRDQSKQKEFYQDAYIFWAQYAKEKDNISLKLLENFPLYREDGEYAPSELADWFYQKTMEISKRFDERNGYPYYQNSFYEKIEGMKKMEQKCDRYVSGNEAGRIAGTRI